MRELLPPFDFRYFCGEITVFSIDLWRDRHFSPTQLAAGEDEHVITYLSLNSFLEEYVLRK